MKTDYERQEDRINGYCSDIEWSVNNISDVLCARDYVEGLDSIEKLLKDMNDKLTVLDGELR